MLPTVAALLMLAAADDWPGWRGPAGNGISTLKDIPVSWAADRNIAWKTALAGRGHSSPVVWGNRVFLTADIEGEPVTAEAPKHHIRGGPFRHPDSTGTNKKHTLKVLCFDAANGKQLWERTAHDGPVYDEVHKFNTYASPTPVVDGKFVYAYFEAQGLYKYDFAGNLIWKISLGKIDTLGLGAGVSPVLFEDKLLVLADQDEGDNSFLAAISTADGKIAWKTPRKARQSWTTPVLAGRELIVMGTENVIAYDPRDGKELWRTEGIAGNSVHSPVFGHGMVYVTTGYPIKKTLAIRLGPDVTDRVAWKYEKGTSYVPSPILYGDYLYLMTDAGLLTCLDARTGEPKYESKRFPVPAHFTSPPVAFDGKLLITSEDGDTYVVKAGSVHEVLGTNALGEPVFASLALAGDSIYVRSGKSLFRIKATNKRE
jgi:outer membrane protein assembly factor BamB